MLGGFMFRDVIQIGSRDSLMMTIILIFLTCAFWIYFLLSAFNVLLKVCRRWQERRQKKRNSRHFEDLSEDHIPLSPLPHRRTSTESYADETKNLGNSPRQEGELADPYSRSNGASRRSITNLVPTSPKSVTQGRPGDSLEPIDSIYRTAVESEFDHRNSISVDDSTKILPKLNTPEKFKSHLQPQIPELEDEDLAHDDSDDDKTLVIRDGAKSKQSPKPQSPQRPQPMPTFLPPTPNLPRHQLTPTPQQSENPRFKLHENPDEDDEEESVKEEKKKFTSKWTIIRN